MAELAVRVLWLDAEDFFDLADQWSPRTWAHDLVACGLPHQSPGGEWSFDSQGWLDGPHLCGVLLVRVGDMPNWAEYLADFHAERAGITEDVLSRSVAGDGTAYHWLARAVATRARIVVDIGCGSGAMSRELAAEGRTVVGVDMSLAELREAAVRGSGPWVRANALRLPIADESVDAVTTSVGLAVIHPTGDLLAEVARVLKPGGVFAAMTPTYRPLNANDMRIGARLAQLMGSPPRFPAAIELSLSPVLAAHQLRKVEDARERYHFTVETRADADLLLRAVYLPSSTEQRIENAAQWLVREAERRGQVKVPIPMRRVVAIK